MLRLQNLTKTYRTGDRALNGVSLTVEPGQVVGLIGPSGAGKSTPVPWPRTPTCCWSTSRRPPSTPRPRGRSCG